MEDTMRRATVLLAIIALLAAPASVLAQEEFTAELDADQEVPAPTLPDGYEGQGSGSATISADESEVTYEVSFEGLTGPATMAHIHYGAPGVAGGILFWLTEMGVDDTPSPLSGTLTEADFSAVDGGPQTFAEALDAIRAGDTYFNIHTEQNPPGEIRGQLTAVAAPDDPPAPTPPPTSTAVAPTETSPTGLPPAMLLLGLAGFGALLIGLRRFGAVRA
jgi:hypothetical protein